MLILLSIALVLGLFVTPTTAKAAEAPATEASTDFEVPALPKADLARPGALRVYELKLARKRYWTGLALGLAGPATVGIAWGSIFVVVGDSTDSLALPFALALGGGLMAVVGSVMAIESAWHHASFLRSAGLDVSIGLSVASLVMPLAFYAATLVLGLVHAPFGWAVFAAGYVSTFALSGAQLAVDGGKLAKSGISVSVAPTRIGNSPGLALSGRF